MTAYVNGAAFERRLATTLKNLGWHVMRAAGSHGPADLTALAYGRCALIQAKSGQRGISTDQWNALHDLAQRLQAEAVVATRTPAGRITWTQITGPATPHTADRLRPAQPWSPAL